MQYYSIITLIEIRKHDVYFFQTTYVSYLIRLMSCKTTKALVLLFNNGRDLQIYLNVWS